MLYLKPPYHIIHGISVFPDHDREDVFHFAPVAPHITRKLDPTTGDMVPQFQLLKYRGDNDLSGGFLTFSVDLSIDPLILDEVKKELRQMHGLRTAPILSPIHFEDGDVKLMILGAQSDSADDDDPQNPDEGTSRFVTAAHHAKPALYGDNNAIFSVELDQNGVQLMETALAGNLSGIGIVYSLHFYALRPAYNVKVSVDWERTQTHFEESFSGRALVLSTDIATVVDKLIEDRVVKIEVDTFLAEGEDTGSFVGNRNQAIEEFKDMITESFFTPATPPGREADDTWNKVSDAANQVGMLVATGGWSGVASFTYRKIDTTQIDKKSMNLSMSERITMRKSIYPQAVLEGLMQIKDANGQPMDLSRFVQEVTLDDPWFDRRRVTAHALADFDSAGIHAMNVEMSYDNKRESRRLSKDTPEAEADWASKITNGVMEDEVEYSYSVEFSGVDVAERPGRSTSPPMIAIGPFAEDGPVSQLSHHGRELRFAPPPAARSIF